MLGNNFNSQLERNVVDMENASAEMNLRDTNLDEARQVHKGRSLIYGALVILAVIVGILFLRTL